VLALLMQLAWQLMQLMLLMSLMPLLPLLPGVTALPHAPLLVLVHNL
jgi:hypothetical protein